MTAEEIFLDLLRAKGNNRILSDIGELKFESSEVPRLGLPQPEPFFNDSVMLVAILPSFKDSKCYHEAQKEHWKWLFE